MMHAQYVNEQDTLRETLRELLEAYASLVPFCEYQGLDVTEMRRTVAQARQTLKTGLAT